MIVLAGADVVGPDVVWPGAAVHIDGDRIVAIEPADAPMPAATIVVDCTGGLVVPGFVDVHVHGVEGIDVLDDAAAVSAVAARLPKYGVTAFCPTSVACSPDDLFVLLEAVSAARANRVGARVLGAHLESNFINPEYRGAQPPECLRTPFDSPLRGSLPFDSPLRGSLRAGRAGDARDFSGDEVLATIADGGKAIAIVTVAPEIDGGLDLVRDLVARGHRVSIGHSGATYEIARAAIDAGARHATHLFNRMSPLGHRAPGVPGAVLESDHVAAEIICDGFHVHPALVGLAIAAKGIDRVMAITDGTAGSGLPPGTRTHLGRHAIVVTERTAELEDGTLAGSVLTMDGAFRMLVERAGLNTVQASRACSATPARELGLTRAGTIEVGALADLVVLDRDRRVQSTYVAGQLAFARNRVSF